MSELFLNVEMKCRKLAPSSSLENSLVPEYSGTSFYNSSNSPTFHAAHTPAYTVLDRIAGPDLHRWCWKLPAFHPISLLTSSKKARSPVSEPLSTDAFCVPSALCTVCLLFCPPVYLCPRATQWALGDRLIFVMGHCTTMGLHFFLFLASVLIR